jgi:adenine phosphoribosyltransferase
MKKEISELKKKIRSIPDFPKKGIMFRDITTLLKDAKALRKAIAFFVDHYKGKKIDKVVAAESRGFIFGGILAHELNAGFVPLRKEGKLPFTTLKQEYELEYGKDAFEIHVDAIKPGDKVLIVDDLLATGGTAKAAIDLVERLKGKVVGCAFLIELSFLEGRKKLEGYEVFTLIDYESNDFY